MKKCLFILLALPIILFGQSQRQTTYVTVPDCYVESFTPVAGGGSLLTGYSQYGSDSCLANLIFMNDSDVIVSHKEFNTATKFDFVSHAISFSNGFLIGGKSSDPSFFHPQLIRTDVSGNVQWAKYFDNLSYWQGQVIRILPEGNNYSLYTFAETPFNDFYRIEGDASGNNFSGWQYTPNTAMSFRIFDAEKMNNSSSHILCGHGNFNSTTTRGGLLMKNSTAGIQWCKQITASGNFKNDIVDVAAAADGNSYSVFVCENLPGNQYSTIVLKFDSLGNKVWAKQLALTTGTLNGCAIIESTAHDFYVAVYDNLFVAYLCKLDAAGNLIWTHKWTPSTTGGASALRLFKDVNGNIVFTGMLSNSYFVARLDANAGGCSFTTSNVISATTVNPVLTTVAFTTTIFTPTVTNEPVVYSFLGYGENMLCGGVGIEEQNIVNEILVYPNPVQGKLTVGNINQPVESVSIFNAMGERVSFLLSPNSTNTNGDLMIDVPDFLPGIYFLRINTGDKIYQSKFIKTGR